MKALLRKDIYQFWDVYKWFLFVLAVVCVVPAGGAVSFGTLFGAILIPTSLIALDEQSQWDSLALMLPYSRTAIVLEKYIMGWISVATPLAIYAAIALARGAGMDEMALLVVFPALALLIQAVNMPINFRFGTTKGRALNALLVGVTVMVGITADVMTSGNIEGPSFLVKIFAHIPPAAYPVAAGALCLASVPLSVRAYTARCGK